MEKGIIGLIVLLLGVAIFALIFVLTQTKVIEKEKAAGADTEQIQKNVKSYQDQLQQEQNKSLGVTPKD